jgi:hypothetical protein
MTIFTRDTIKGSIQIVVQTKDRARARGINGLPTFLAMASEELRLRELYYQLCLQDYADGTLGIHDDWSCTS